ncbi:hypothetical protein [Empedobacter sedimenti]|uniref:hypothetical protein n=1 Tax=Empedobacter sedimenti TaxID=3042610 RepID=UPI0024A6CE46|nr:hypothetical protein [Empedobacter sedimenti]
MKKYIAFTLLIITYSLSAQLGINTNNPQQLVHIDGQKNNPATGKPTSAQQLDDLVITKDGRLGIGITEPTTRVEINNTTTGAIKIVDGTQGDGKILISDSQGIGTWQTPATFKNVAKGVFLRDSNNNPIWTSSDNNGGYKFTNAEIKLSKGKWIINTGMTLKSKIAIGSIVWVHMYLSSNKTSITQTGFTHLGPAGTSTAFAGQLHGFRDAYSDGTYPDNDNFVTGSSVIEVTDPETTIYLLIENLATGTTGQKFYTASDYWENFFYAIPIN